jgi:pyridoxine 5-phosphate synthase
MRLAINIDHIATLRNARGGAEPDPVTAAYLCELAGAEGIVCHLREDRRHIRDRDVRLLRETVKTKLDLEMAATDEIIRIAIETKPELVTLVPEHRRELTTESGLDVVGQREILRKAIDRFHANNILVSLFVDPLKAQLEAAKSIEADFIEIHTGEYAEARHQQDQQRLLVDIIEAAHLARSMELRVNAGHGINYINVKPIAAIFDIEELSIGHSIIARAVAVGLERAVKEMIDLMK